MGAWKKLARVKDKLLVAADMAKGETGRFAGVTERGPQAQARERGFHSQGRGKSWDGLQSDYDSICTFRKFLLLLHFAE